MEKPTAFDHEGSSSTKDATSKTEETTLWAQKEGDATFVEVHVNEAASVSRLTKEVVKEIGLTERLSTLTLHVVDKEGKLGDALDSTETVTNALRDYTGKIRLVVKVGDASAAAASTPSG